MAMSTSLKINQNSLARTNDNELCVKLPEVNKMLTAIQSSIEKILKGTNPVDNRNQLMKLNQDVVAMIATLGTLNSIQSPTTQLTSTGLLAAPMVETPIESTSHLPLPAQANGWRYFSADDWSPSAGTYNLIAPNYGQLSPRRSRRR